MFQPQYSKDVKPRRGLGRALVEDKMASNNLKPRLVSKVKDKDSNMATEKIEHWSGEDISFEYAERTEAFAGIEDAYNALADQAAAREEKDKDGNVKEGKDRNSLVLADLLANYNGWSRWAARQAAVDARMKDLGIDDASEGLYKNLVTTLRAKYEAKDPGNKDNLKNARLKALEKVKSLSLDE